MNKKYRVLPSLNEAIENIADENLQIRAWFGLGPEVSSAEEMCERIYDHEPIEWIEKILKI